MPSGIAPAGIIGRGLLPAEALTNVCLPCGILLSDTFDSLQATRADGLREQLVILLGLVGVSVGKVDNGPVELVTVT
jgi:hypothetical protein